jgi:hypothetical protein
MVDVEERQATRLGWRSESVARGEYGCWRTKCFELGRVYELRAPLRCPRCDYRSRH